MDKESECEQFYEIQNMNTVPETMTVQDMFKIMLKTMENTHNPMGLHGLLQG
jgi:hypothetical protein